MLIIVPVRNLVLFPGTVVPVAINRERSLAAAQEAVRAERKVGFLLQHDPDLQSPTGRDLHKVGTVASIVRYVTGQDGTHHLVVQGERRFRVLDWQNGLPFMVARVEYLPEIRTTTSEVEARALNLKRLSAEADLAAAAGAGRARERDPGGRVAVDARRPGRELHGHQGGREAAAAGNARSQGAPRPRHRAADQAHRSAAAAAPARGADARSDRRAPQGSAAARAAAPDPQGARRGRRVRRRDRRAARGDRARPACRRKRSSRRARSSSAWSACPTRAPSTRCCAPGSTG